MDDTVKREVLETNRQACGCVIQQIRETWQGRTLTFRNFLYCPTHE